VDRLLVDAEDIADLGPRPATPPGPVDEVAQHRVTGLAELTHHGSRRGQLVEGVVTVGVRADRLDEFVKGGSGSHAVNPRLTLHDRQP
jgi:hypothetical protein